MILSVELTLYPLQDNYLPIIERFIDHLGGYDGLSLQTFRTATIMMGEYDTVMKALADAMKWNQENQGKGVFVAKFLLDYEAL